MWAIFKMELTKSIKDKGLYFWTFILPIIFIVLFISIFTVGTSGTEKEQVILSIVPGYTVMFVFFIMISMCFSFIEDRDKGMVARIASTPLPPSAYLVGKWITYMFIVMIQIGIMFIFGKIVYNIPLEQPVRIAMLALILTIAITGMGLALSLIVRTNNMGISITQVIALGGAVLGGLWMPFEMMPGFLQRIGKFTPQYWAHDAFKGAMAGTLHDSDFWVTSLILIAFGLLSFSIALLMYPNFLRRAKS